MILAYFLLLLIADCLLVVNTQVYLQVSNTTSHPAAKGIYSCSHSSNSKLELSTITRCYSVGNFNYVLYYKYVIVANSKQQKRWFIGVDNTTRNEYYNIYGAIEISSDPWELSTWKLLSNNAAIPSIVEGISVELYEVDCKPQQAISHISEILYSKLLSIKDRHIMDSGTQDCGAILDQKIAENSKILEKFSMVSLIYCNWLLYRDTWDESYQCYTSITTDTLPTSPASYVPTSYFECNFDDINCLYYASLNFYTKYSLIQGEFMITKALSDALIASLDATKARDIHVQQLMGANKLAGILVGDVIHNYYNISDKSIDVGCNYVNNMNMQGYEIRREVLTTICHQLLSLPSNINTLEIGGYGRYHWDRSVSIAMSLLGVGAIDTSAMHVLATIKYMEQGSNASNGDKNNYNITDKVVTYINNSDSMRAVLSYYNIHPVALIKSPNVRAAIILNEALKHIFSSSVLSDTQDHSSNNKLAVIVGSLFQAIAPTILSLSTEGSQWIGEVFMLRTIAVHSMQWILMHLDHYSIRDKNDFILMDPLAYFGAPCRGLFLLAYQGLSVEKYLPSSQNGFNDMYNFRDHYLPSLYYKVLLKTNPHWFNYTQDATVSTISDGKKHIKIGFLSSHFFRHPVGRLLAQVMFGLKNETFIIDTNEIVYDVYVCINPVNYHGGKHINNAGEPDDIYQALRDTFMGVERYIELSTDPVAAANKVRQLELDVLVFGDIFMDSITAHIAMLRMANVQIAFWGHPYSSGYPTIDYFISNVAYESSFQRSRVSHKHGRMLDFSEQIVVFDSLSHIMYHKLPRTTQNHYGSKEEYVNWLYGIGYDVDNHAFNTSKGYKYLSSVHVNDVRIYGCYQTLMKMHPLLDDVLIGILGLDLNGVVLLARNPRQYIWYDNFISRLKSKLYASNDSLVMSRIIIVNQVQHNTYEDIICGADVTLDPFPFGGGVTLTDSLSCPLKPVPYVTSGYLQTVHNLGVGIGLNVNAKTNSEYCSIVDKKEVIHLSNTSNYDKYYISEFIKEAVNIATSNQIRHTADDKIGIHDALYGSADTIYEWANFIHRLV